MEKTGGCLLYTSILRHEVLGHLVLRVGGEGSQQVDAFSQRGIEVLGGQDAVHAVHAEELRRILHGLGLIQDHGSRGVIDGQEHQIRAVVLGVGQLHGEVRGLIGEGGGGHDLLSLIHISTISSALCRGCKRCQRECANDGLEFDAQAKKKHVNLDNCVGCGRCLGACNFDAIHFAQNNAPKDLNCRMVEYAKAVVDGRPNFHVSLIVDVSPNCDCHSENDAPILPNIGMLASFDPIALDQACADLCQKAEPIANSQLGDNMRRKGFVDLKDHFKNSKPEVEWKSCLEHAAKIGLGSREYELIEM